MTEDRPNYLIITLDSLRYDTTLEARTPQMNSDLGSPVLAYANALWTWPAHWALFAGWYPDAIGQGPLVDRYHHRLLPRPGWSKGCNTSIELLRQEGYSIAGTASCAPFRAPIWPSVFSHYRFEEHATLEVQIEWLTSIRDKLPSPWLIFVNACETHYPYGQSWDSLAALERLRAPHYRQEAIRMANAHSINGPGYPKPGESNEADSLYALFRQAQRTALEHVDELWPALKESLPSGPFMALLCGDHGECFGEEGNFGHGFYHPCVRDVPLIVKAVDR